MRLTLTLKQKIQASLAQKGWQLLRAETPEGSKQCYLSFLVDPEDSKAQQVAWLVVATQKEPQDKAEAFGPPLVLSKGWEQRLAPFIEEACKFFVQESITPCCYY